MSGPSAYAGAVVTTPPAPAPPMSARVPAFDWARTPLGPQGAWPPGLHSVVDLVLSSAFPMILLWGPDLVQIYNDGYSVILGPKEPGALGQPTRECWPEVWHINEPIYRQVWQGETFYFEDQLYPLTRHGFPEEAYFTLCYSPVRQDGEIGGVLVTITETTPQVLGARRLNLLREHAETLAQVQYVAELRRLVQTAPARPDAPFTALYLDEAGGVPGELQAVLDVRQPLVLDWPPRSWPVMGVPPRPAVALPLDGVDRDRPGGVLVVGLNEQVRLDGAYRDFLGGYARQLAAALVRLHSQAQAELNRRLDEERAALAAFTAFTEAVGTQTDAAVLARQAAEVLLARYPGSTVVYYEPDGPAGGTWAARVWSEDLERQPDLLALLRAGLPAHTPFIAQVLGGRQAVFTDGWNAEQQQVAHTGGYTRSANLPVIVGSEVRGLLGMGGREAQAWTDRDRALVSAVGRGLTLALERAAGVEQLERQRERLADLNAELGAFITRTAHSLERPAAQLAQVLDPGQPTGLDGLPPYDPAELRDEVTRLRGVARDLRQLARLEQHALTLEPLAVAELFEELRDSSGSRNVRWLLGPLPIVRGDRALLRQALDVLMTFTLSATRGAQDVMVSSDELDGEVRVIVEDDGPGLSGEEAATLFDLAVRTDQSVPLLAGGGLVQVRRVLARHGGWAWAESRSCGGKVVLAFPQDDATTALEALFRPGG